MTITLEVIQNGCVQYLAWKPIFIVWINSLGMNAIAGVFEHVTISAPPLKYACISFECLTGPNISLKVFTKLLWPFTYIKYIELCSMKFNLDQLVVSISRTLFSRIQHCYCCCWLFSLCLHRAQTLNDFVHINLPLIVFQGHKNRMRFFGFLKWPQKRLWIMAVSFHYSLINLQRKLLCVISTENEW